MESTQLPALIPFSSRSKLILFSHLRLDLPKDQFPVGLPVKSLKALLPSSNLATCPTHLNLLGLITLTTLSILKKYNVLAPMGRFQLELIYLYFPPSSHLVYLFLSCRPLVVITTLSTGLVGVEITSVSWLGQLTVGV